MRRTSKPDDLALARRCAAAIRQLHPEAEIILYGSRARGTPDPDSDMDLLVLTTKELPWQDEEEVIDAVYALELETGIIISPIVESRSRWYTAKYQAMPLAEAVVKEGIRL